MAKIVVLASVGCAAACDARMSSQARPLPPDASGPIAGMQAGSAGPATFTVLYDNIFRGVCGIPDCHGTGVAGVDMSSRAAAYASLVNQPPQAMGLCAALGKRRVVPFQPDQSLLVAKLEIDAPCGQQMPIGGLLSSANRALIQAWISAGAQDE